MTNIKNMAGQMKIMFEQMKATHNSICPKDRQITTIDLDWNNKKFLIETIQSKLGVTKELHFDDANEVAVYLNNEIIYWNEGFGSIIRAENVRKSMNKLYSINGVGTDPADEEIKANLKKIADEYTDKEKRLEEHGYNTDHKLSTQIFNY